LHKCKYLNYKPSKATDNSQHVDCLRGKISSSEHNVLSQKTNSAGHVRDCTTGGRRRYYCRSRGTSTAPTREAEVHRAAGGPRTRPRLTAPEQCRTAPHRRSHSNSITPPVRSSSTTPHHHQARARRRCPATVAHHTNQHSSLTTDASDRAHHREEECLMRHRRYCRPIEPQRSSCRTSNGANHRDRVDSRVRVEEKEEPVFLR